jgi:hypothetical protein
VVGDLVAPLEDLDRDPADVNVALSLPPVPDIYPGEEDREG